MNILGIDFGTKRIGLAWMQEGLDVVLPYGRIEQVNEQQTIEELYTLVNQEHIAKIVIGLPLTLEDGSENAHTKKIRRFAQVLHEKISLPVVFIDERLSSFQADDMGGEASRDEKAAMVILENYKMHDPLDTLNT